MDTWIQFVIMLTMVITMLAGAIVGLIKFGMSLSSLRKQVTPNGGDTDSLGDRVVRLEALQHSQCTTLEAHGDALERIESSLESYLKRDI